MSWMVFPERAAALAVMVLGFRVCWHAVDLPNKRGGRWWWLFGGGASVWDSSH
jgi:hypothetical protein